jgi:hypothetical protein
MGVWIAAGVLGVIGVLMTFSGLGGVRRKPVSGGFGAILGGALVLVGGGLALVGVNLRTYERLTAEHVVAQIEFKQTGPQRYDATLRTANEEGQLGEGQPVPLEGDQWLMGARVIKFPGWATVAGLDARYRLDVLTSFSEGWRQQGEPHLLNRDEDVAVDIWKLARDRGKVVEIDASYGSAAYHPMADGAVYEISVTQTGGLVSRQVNEAAETAVRQWDGRSPPPPLAEDLIAGN